METAVTCGKKKKKNEKGGSVTTKDKRTIVNETCREVTRKPGRMRGQRKGRRKLTTTPHIYPGRRARDKEGSKRRRPPGKENLIITYYKYDEEDTAGKEACEENGEEKEGVTIG